MYRNNTTLYWPAPSSASAVPFWGRLHLRAVGPCLLLACTLPEAPLVTHRSSPAEGTLAQRATHREVVDRQGLCTGAGVGLCAARARAAARVSCGRAGCGGGCGGSCGGEYGRRYDGGGHDGGRYGGGGAEAATAVKAAAAEEAAKSVKAAQAAQAAEEAEAVERR